MSSRRTNEQRSHATRAKLVASARTRFASAGYAATSLQDVAAGAEVSIGAFYHHWTGKKPLLAAVVTAIHQDLAREVATALPRDVDPLDQLEHAAALFLRRCRDPEIGRVLLVEAPAVLGESWHELDDHWWHRPTLDLLRQAQARDLLAIVDLDGLATALLGSISALGRSISLDRPAMTHEAASALFRTLLNGVRR